MPTVRQPNPDAERHVSIAGCCCVIVSFLSGRQPVLTATPNPGKIMPLADKLPATATL
ncbi:hypothetical protein [Janthinobacterium lividum]|uniref:hypothetical protein n=1 Tax=Janthinobacterium lividum TaxID=29581 RepID=UPI000B21CA4B|nr:hypothetical protein [Janthinobacterium lividum]